MRRLRLISSPLLSAVAVGVEDDAEVRARLLHAVGNRLHRRRVLGVGDVVGEASVRLQKLARRNVRAEGGKHHIGIEPARAVARVDGIEPARAVARVDGDLFARERLVPARLFPHEPHEIFAVSAEEGNIFHAPFVGVRGGSLVRKGEDFRDVFAFQTAFFGEKFQSVHIVGQVARGDHDGSVRAHVLLLQDHEHRRGRGKPAKQRVCAAFGQRF